MATSLQAELEDSLMPRTLMSELFRPYYPRGLVVPWLYAQPASHASTRKGADVHVDALHVFGKEEVTGFLLTL